MTTQKQWQAVARMLLVNKNHIDERIKLEEKRFENIVLASFDSLMNADAIIDRVINQMERKDKLTILKNRIEKLVENMPKRLTQVIRFYFFKGHTTERIAKKLNVTPRTIFRDIEKGLNFFAQNMSEYGINELTLKEIIRFYPNVFASSEPMPETEGKTPN